MSHTEQFEIHAPGSVTIVADAAGPKDGPLVILLHGGGQTRNTWRETVAHLSDLGYRAISMDQRGHGDSSYAPDGNYTPDSFKSDLLAVMDSLSGPPVLIGASLGGIVSLFTAGEIAPHRVRGLVMVDVAVQTNPYGTKRIQDFMMANPDGFASVDEAADAVAAFSTDRPRPRDTSGLMRNLRKRGDRYYWHYDPEFLPVWHKAHIAARNRLEAAARALTIPTLLVHAGRSEVIGEDEVADLQRLIPQLDYVRIEQAGHMVMGDKNNTFNQAIVSFLDAHPLLRNEN